MMSTWIRTPRRALLAALLALCALFWAGTAPAQPVNYGKLFAELGLGGSEEAAPAMSRPAQLAPLEGAEAAEGGADAQAGGEDPDRAPEVAAYGRVAAEQRAEANMIQRATGNVTQFSDQLKVVLSAAPEMPRAIERAMARNAPDGQPSHFLGVLVLTVICILIGRAVVGLIAVFVALPLMQAAQRGPRPQTLGDKLPVLALRFALTVALTAVGLAVAVALGVAVTADHAPTRDTAGAILGIWAVYMVVDTTWRMVIAPYLSDHRIPRFSDAEARKLYFWASSSAGLSILLQGVAAWVEGLGVPRETHALVSAGVTFVGMSTALGLIWANRPAISNAILGGMKREEASWFAAACSLVWAPFASLYLIAAWIEGAIRLVQGLEQKIPLLTGAFLTLGVGLVVYAICVFVVEKLFGRMRARRRGAEPAAAPISEAVMEGDGPDDGDDEGGPARRLRPVEEVQSELFPQMRVRRHPLRSFEDLAQRAAAIFATGVAAWLLAVIWGGDQIFRDGAPLDFVQDVIDKLFIGYVAFHAVRIWLDKRIEEEGGAELDLAPGDEGGGSSASRLATLLPLFRAFILFVILAVTALTIAMDLGVNVAPLFAGAGIVGLAIGFGAQALVKDILSGVFFLLDDAFRKGEYIDVGDVKGTVEKISIRSFQLRHHLGALHTIPFGEITHLTNFSRDWVMMKLPLRLTYDTDVDKVRKLVKKLGQSLLDHPTEGPKFLQPLKSQGVIQMEDSAMIVRVKFMTRPGDQWTTRKLVYQEIRNLFEREGIKFAHREVTVRIPDIPQDRPMTAAEKEAVGAAAQGAAEIANEQSGAATAEMR